MSGAEVAVRDETRSAALAIADSQVDWTPTQQAALAQIGVADAPRADQLVLLHRAQTTGLDPFSRQLYMIKRREKTSRKVNGQWVDEWLDKWTLQTGIDGFRVTARRAARREGESYTYEDPQWCGPDGRWADVWLKDTPPSAARVVIVKTDRQGRTERFPGVARWGAYVQTGNNNQPTGRWRSGGDQMLAKCAEALALRMAYPQDLSGVYAAEEMEQADSPRTAAAPGDPGRQPEPKGTPTDDERAAWYERWVEEVQRATTFEGLQHLGHVLNHAVDSGHTTAERRTELRRWLADLARQLTNPPPAEEPPVPAASPAAEGSWEDPPADFDPNSVPIGATQ